MLPESHRPWVWDMVGHWFAAYIPLVAWESRCRKAASSAYGRARAAERKHSLPVPVDYHRENTLLYARAGALPVKEVAVHQKWLAETMSPAAAHVEFVRLLVASARGGAPLGTDWHRRLRSSAKAAGLTVDEDARVLAIMFGACPGNVPDGLLDAAAKVFAKSRPDDGAGLADLFPTTDTDGAALLRMLDAAGVVDAMADGTLTPPSGLAGWVSHFYSMYRYVKAQYGGIMQQRMPAELFDLVGRIGPRLRESGERVKMSEGRYCRPYLDADLADAVIAAGVGIEDADRRTLYYWVTGRSVTSSHWRRIQFWDRDWKLSCMPIGETPVPRSPGCRAIPASCAASACALMRYSSALRAPGCSMPNWPSLSSTVCSISRPSWRCRG